MKKTRKSLLFCLVLLVVSLCMAIAACGGSSKVELRFNTMGGEAIESVSLEVGAEYTLPTPVWENHGFEGWYTNSEHSGEAVTTVVAEKSTTFYAKWSELAVITLELGSGATLEGATNGKLYLRAGENLYIFMEDYTPVRDGFKFDCWYVDNAALSPAATMPAEGITLTAHYNVDYTVEAYLQKPDLSGYERGEDIVGYAPVGASYTPTPSVHGFDVVPNANAVTTKVLSENPDENVFRFYFDRREFTVIFQSNYPTGLDEATETRSVRYGTETELPDDLFYANGFCLVGWATSAAGEVEYDSGYIASRLFNAGEVAPATFVVEDDCILYAIWRRGYTDIFGGYDYIYIFEDAGVAYLNRGGVFFEGTYNARKEEFIFRDENGSVMLEGALRADGTYTYYNLDRAGYATLYVFGKGIDESTKILFDEYDEITYSVEDQDGKTSVSKGTYRLDENGYYVAEFTTGSLSGTTMTFVVGKPSTNGVKRSLFEIRNEEEYNLGTLLNFFVSENQVNYYVSMFSLTLNGFSVASFNTPDGYEYYYYLKQGDIIALYDADFQLVGLFKFMEMNGVNGYMAYDPTHDATYTSESGATLTLDGLYKATYRNGNTVVEGYYSMMPSAFGGKDGKIVMLRNGDTVLTFIVSGDGSNTFVERPANYSEVYYKNEAGDRLPLIVLNETKNGDLNIYGMNSDGDFVRYAEGSYIFDEDTGLYLGTVDRYLSVEVIEMPVDLTGVTAFVFDVSTLYIRGDYYNVACWYSTTTEQETTRFDTVYEEENGDSTLTLVAIFAIYRTEDRVFKGLYSLDSDNIIAVSASYDGIINTFYFEINEEQGTFVHLKELLGSAIGLLADGTATTNERITFDGKGGAVYTVKAGESVTTYEGTCVLTKETTFDDAPIFEFCAEGLTFKFILVNTSDASLFARYNESYNGVYTNGSDSLELDGYSYAATYTVGDVPYEGIYSLPEENVVCLMSNSSSDVFYFDLKEGRSFTVRGEEFGTYLLFDNQDFGGVYLMLNGYGVLTAFTHEEGEDGKVVRVELGVGTYYLNADGLFELRYMAEDGPWFCVGATGTVSISSRVYNAFFVLHDEVVYSYVDEADWSVLYLDGFGNAVKFNTMGEAEVGTYILITESLFYYANNAGTSASIYAYDNEKGTANAIPFTPLSYYTENLESLLFTNYGFMIMGGNMRYYYNIVDDTVYIYHYAQDGEVGNEYGFVEENFGAFDNEKVWNNKTYYLNSGYALMFKRAENSKNEYPITVRSSDGSTSKHALESITFTPSGGTEFSVNGSVSFNGATYNCVVTRKVNEEGEVELYLVLGNYRFDISVSYHGETTSGSLDNYYEVTDMQYQIVIYSWNYLYVAYQYAQMGYSVNNTFGVIILNEHYDENGDLVKGSSIATAAFGIHSNMFDTKGNLVSVDRAPYTVDSKGVHTIEFTAEDGYLYRIYFEVVNDFVEIFGYYSYHLQAFTRVESFTLGTDGEYRVEVERVIATESESLKAGAYQSINFYKNGELLTPDGRAFFRGNTLYYLVKGDESDGYISITYYFVNFVENIPEAPEETQQSGVNTYLSASLTVKDARRYAINDYTFADFDAQTDEVIMIVYANTIFIAKSTVSNGDGSYTVTAVTGEKFRVTKAATIERIEEAEEE